MRYCRECGEGRLAPDVETFPALRCWECAARWVREHWPMAIKLGATR